MLSIRMQRVGRKGLAQFRVIVQDSRLSPKSGKVVASLGHYNPHTKENGVDFDRAATYLNNGAQPSPRVARLLADNGIKLPEWVELRKDLEGKLKNVDKLRKNQPDEPAAEEAPVEDTSPANETPTTDEPAAEDATKEEVSAAEEKPAEEVEEAPSTDK